MAEFLVMCVILTDEITKVNKNVPARGTSGPLCDGLSQNYFNASNKSVFVTTPKIKQITGLRSWSREVPIESPAWFANDHIRHKTPSGIVGRTKVYYIYSCAPGQRHISLVTPLKDRTRKTVAKVRGFKDARCNQSAWMQKLRREWMTVNLPV